MRYRGKDIELIGEKMVFGRRTAWIRLVEDNSFQQVLWDDIVFDEDHHLDISHIRFIALATRIKEEIAQKRILAPYESSLIPLPHQILILEKLMKAPQTRFLLADEVGMGKTIEAGLALKELKLRGEIKRTLLIVPKSAMLQWQSEMQQHFKEQFHIYDSQLINSMASMKFYQGCLYLCKDTKFLANHNSPAAIKIGIFPLTFKVLPSACRKIFSTDETAASSIASTLFFRVRVLFSSAVSLSHGASPATSAIFSSRAPSESGVIEFSCVSSLKALISSCSWYLSIVAS